MVKRIVAVVLGAALAGCSSSSGGKAAGEAASAAAATRQVQQTDDGLRVTDQVTVKATVVAIDHKKREVTLRGPEGNQETFTVGPEARNFPQVRKGDEVVATYYEAVAVKLRKPGEVAPGVTVAQDVVRAAPGAMPGGAVGETVSVTATVEKVDRKKQTVTLKGPQGKVVTVHVPDRERFEKVKVKDLVEITYTQAVAIAVEKPSK